MLLHYLVFFNYFLRLTARDPNGNFLSSCNPIWVTYRFGLHRKTLEACMIGLAFASVVCIICMIIGHIENSPRLPSKSSHFESGGGESWIPSMNFKCLFSLFHNRIHTSPSPLARRPRDRTANRERRNVIDQSAKIIESLSHMLCRVLWGERSIFQLWEKLELRHPYQCSRPQLSRGLGLFGEFMLALSVQCG